MIPENKFYVLNTQEAQLPKMIHVVGKRFKPFQDEDGMSRNKAYLIYAELKPLEDIPEDAIKQFYEEISSEDIFTLLQANYEHN